MNVNVNVMDVNKSEYLQDLLTQRRQENKQLKSDTKWIEFNENMVEKLHKSDGGNSV